MATIVNAPSALRCDFIYVYDSETRSIVQTMYSFSPLNFHGIRLHAPFVLPARTEPKHRSRVPLRIDLHRRSHAIRLFIRSDLVFFFVSAVRQASACSRWRRSSRGYILQFTVSYFAVSLFFLLPFPCAINSCRQIKIHIFVVHNRMRPPMGENE